jgi:hypothetical protein
MRRVFLFLICFAVATAAQEQPKAVLVDEFGNITCGDLSARLDNFIFELQQKPNSVGYVVLSADPTTSSAANEKYIDGYARWRRFDEERLLIATAKLPSAIKAQLWLLPTAAELPTHLELSSTRTLPHSTRKIRLFSLFGEYGPCYTGAPLRLASNYLSSEPGVIANIVIGSKTQRGFKKARFKTIRLFRDKYGIAETRLKFFWTRTEYEPEGSDIGELWIIRKRTN